MNYSLILFGLIPSFAWLIFYLKEDLHPEPKKLIWETFFTGAVITFVVLKFQISFNSWLIGLGVMQYSVISLLGLAAIEEVFKFVAAYLVISHHRKEFDEPIDAMIYMVVAALGFAAVENVAAAFNTPNLAMETIALRFVGATLLHTLASGTVGYFWAKSAIFRKRRFFWIGLGLAIVLHTVFNYLIIVYEPVVIPTIFLILFALAVLYDFEKLKHIE
ncbi:MAG: PrsW family glutamic-type intramembrane protease [bacterium]|nr:PrsW family glutamic-type intramembrane protease [bacterium]